MTTLNLADLFPVDILEFGTATLRALKAMRRGDPERMRSAFLRYMDISVKITAKPHEQIALDATRIQRRGRINLDDWRRIDAAIRDFAGEPPKGPWIVTSNTGSTH